MQLDSHESRLLVQEIDEVARAAADIADPARQHMSGNRLETSLRIVGFVLNSRHPFVDAFVALGGQSGDSLAELFEIIDEAAPVQAKQPTHETGIAKYGRHPLFENMTDFVDGFAPHQSLPRSKP
jgi:hypothetical protein